MNNKFNGFDEAIATTAERVSDINEMLEEKARYEAEKDGAFFETAKNTKSIKGSMDIVINNQNTQIDNQIKQIKLMEHQLNIIKEIFNNTDRSIEIEKELIELIKKDKNHPIAKLLEKTGDFGINVLANYTTPLIMSTLKTILIKYGILL